MQLQTARADEETPLCHQTLDRRIRSLATETRLLRRDSRSTAIDPAVLRPRWIRAAEIVRRMRPFVVYN